MSASSHRAANKPSSIRARQLDKRLSEGGFGKKWRIQLARADLKLTVGEFLLAHFAASAALFTVSFLVLFRGDIITSSIAALIGFFIPRILVGQRISSRLKKFEQQLPDTLGLWVNAMRSGYSVAQAMEAISRDAAEPTKTEFRRVVQELSLGISMPDALGHMLERVESKDFDFVVTAVNIQREVGGGLAEILSVLATTIRERIKLKGEIMVLTSQGRLTGKLISGLPIALGLFLRSSNPKYIDQMFEDRTCGWPMIGVGLVMIGAGYAVINKIVDIDI
ncbi:MAG: type II secretion system F family protein [Anaerolineae bacterium]|nr:type II secretion system F family protein [Anaerolineae bacterium]